MYKCKCGKEYENKQSYAAHCSHCKINLGRDPIDKFGSSRSWAKGKTKDDPIYGDSLRKIGEAIRQRNLSGNNPLSEWNKHKPKQSYINQSITRKKKYASGELTPAPGVGRGKYSYIEYNDTRTMFRSTYEFIYALYLLYNHIEFEYETVRVEYQGHTYISDFLVGSRIIEIKGDYHDDLSTQKKAFESAGYEYEIKFWKDIECCYEYLQSKLDIDSILESIRVGHDSKNYYVYKFVADEVEPC